MGFLNEILAANRSAVEDPRFLDGLPREGPKNRPSLRKAIESHSPDGAILVEFKRVSPGQAHPVLPERSLAEFVRAVEPAAPAGLSCLATGPSFRGSPRDVLELSRLSPRPVLFKDFIVNDRQLEAAQRSGASAVLLIARLATDASGTPRLDELADSAHRRGLEVLLEFHAETELSEAEGVAADMFGVNARDLDSLRIERAVAGATLRAARRAGLRPLLGLSGVDSADDAARFWSAGVDGILVGSSVARASDPAALLRSLVRPQAGKSR